MLATIFSQYIVPIIGTGLGAMASYAIYKGIQWLKSRVKTSTGKQALDSLEELITKVIHSTEQTFVKNLKNNGQWGSASSYVQAANKTFEQVKEFGAKQIETLKKDGLDVEPYIRMSIEAILHSIKKN